MSFILNDSSFLKSIDLSSFNITNINNISYMFKDYSSLRKENIKINNINIKYWKN